MKGCPVLSTVVDDCLHCGPWYI